MYGSVYPKNLMFRAVWVDIDQFGIHFDRERILRKESTREQDGEISQFVEESVTLKQKQNSYPDSKVFEYKVLTLNSGFKFS